MHVTASLTEAGSVVWVMLLPCEQRDGQNAGTLSFLLLKRTYKRIRIQNFADVIPETS
jgi:hypothetical protein